VAYWACARTEPQREAAAVRFLQLAQYEVYLPRLRAVRFRNRRKIVVNPPLFPSYLFIRIVNGGWWNARWCPGVARLLTAGDGPLPVPDALIAEIKRREVGGVVELPQRDGLRVGEQVKITAGPFTGQLGLYAGMRGNERVLVLLALLGGQVRTELAKDAIEAIRS
jgi:transcriptional antiterminator RfaH